MEGGFLSDCFFSAFESVFLLMAFVIVSNLPI